MKLTACLFLCALIGASVAQSRWQGTWSEGKRNFGGNFYICVDGENAFGTYSNAGLITGKVRGNQLFGEWHEAGYYNAFGSFVLTMNTAGNSFTGTWKYSEDSAANVNWSGNRVDTDRPTDMQCLIPAPNGRVAGEFEGTQNICYDARTQYQNTKFPTVFANFDGFGILDGYSSNGGKNAVLSNYAASATDSIMNARPENAATPFGPSQTQNPSIVPGLKTDRIAIGVAIDGATFCGFFWKGFYNDQIGNEAICLSRTLIDQPEDSACGVNALTRQRIDAANAGLTDDILAEVQRAFNYLPDPIIVVNGNPVTPTPVGDDDDDVNPAPVFDDDDDVNPAPVVDDDDNNADPPIYIIKVSDDDDNGQNYIVIYLNDDDNGNGGSSDDDDNGNPAPIFLPVPQVPIVPFVPPVQDPIVVNVPVFVPIPTNVGGTDDDDQVPIVIINDDGNPVVVPVPVPAVSDIQSLGTSDADLSGLFGSPASTLTISFGLVLLALLI